MIFFIGLLLGFLFGYGLPKRRSKTTEKIDTDKLVMEKLKEIVRKN